MTALGDFSPGDVLTASDLNAIGTWTTYTPTWTGTGGATTLGNGTLVGYYTQLNDLVFVRLRLTWGSTTAATGITEWRLTYPSGLSPANVAGVHEIGSAAVLDSGTAIYRTVAVDIPGAGIGFYAADGGPTIGSLNPMTWTTNDQITATLTYQVS